MSDKTLSRRSTAEIYFQGVDISASIKPYLISLTYTDNEEDETDDLQIRLQDRDGIWLEKWLNDAVQAAASESSSSLPQGSSSQYKVTPQIGLNVRSGPSTNYKRLGAFPYGTIIEIFSIKNNWASIKYNGQDAYISAAYIQKTDSSSTSNTTPSNKGLKVHATILRKNWNADGKDQSLDCGTFELDSVSASGPPAEVTIKCTSLPYTVPIRQTKKSKSWEGYTLSGIAKEMASKSGMGYLYESAYDPKYERVEQITESDISFLSKLCHNAGISLKTTNNMLVLFDQASYERKNVVVSIRKGSGFYAKYKLLTGSSDTKYTSCRVSYRNPSTKSVISAIAYIDDYDAKKKDNQQLEISAKVNSIGEAQRLAAKSLRLKNKYEYSATFAMPGDPKLVAGATVYLYGWGPWSGKYIIKQAKHSIGNSGYTTQISLRRTLEGY